MVESVARCVCMCVCVRARYNNGSKLCVRSRVSMFLLRDTNDWCCTAASCELRAAAACTATVDCYSNP